MNTRTVGLDWRGNRLLLAATSQQSGRLAVERLEEIPAIDALADALSGEARVRLAIPDLNTIVKTVQLPEVDAVSLEDRIGFELTQSLLEDARAFQFDFVSTGLNERHLGFIWRREQLIDLARRLGLDNGRGERDISHRVRSIALGRGYLAVCDGRDDSLVILADLTDECASICYLYNRRIVDVAAMPLAGFDLGAESGRRRFGVDLRTLLNYKQSTLLDAGISVPPIGLLLTGEAVDDPLLAAVRESFPIAVGRPSPHHGFFGSVGEAARNSLPLYLTALGLTVN